MRRDGPSDKTLLRRARQGDRESFLALLRRYDPRLRRLSLRLLADSTRVERVLNRAYLMAWRSLPFLKRSEPAAGWLYRIVYNVCINEMRWEPPRAAPRAPDGDPVDPVPLPAAPAERRLMGLRALRPAERIPLVLVDGEGLSLEAAARMMRREAVEVARDLTNARGRWRAFVSGEPEPLPEPVVPAEAANGAERHKPGRPLAPSPAATMAKLAALAAPTAPREPGGHVKLLASTPGESGPPPLAAKPPTGRRTSGADPAPADRPTSKRSTGSEPGAAAPSAPKAPPSPPKARPVRAGTRKSSRSAAARSDGADRVKRAKPSKAPVTEPDPAAATLDGGDAEPRDPAASATPEVPSAPTGGAGARRKRRRDAKRAARPRPRGGGQVSGAAKPTSEGGGSRDDRDPG
ncbi:MAG: sigma factor [Acidimicrobiales bacterium]